MQKPNPVIKNYILNPEPLIIGEKNMARKNNVHLKTNNNKISMINFIQRQCVLNYI